MLKQLLLYGAIVTPSLVCSASLADPVVDDFERTALGSNWRILFGGDSVDIINNSDLGLKSNSTRSGVSMGYQYGRWRLPCSCVGKLVCRKS